MATLSGRAPASDRGAQLAEEGRGGRAVLPRFLLNVRHYFANLDALESDRLRNHLRHLIRRSPSSVL